MAVATGVRWAEAGGAAECPHCPGQPPTQGMIALKHQGSHHRKTQKTAKQPENPRQNRTCPLGLGFVLAVRSAHSAAATVHLLCRGALLSPPHPVPTFGTTPPGCSVICTSEVSESFVIAGCGPSQVTRVLRPGPSTHPTERVRSASQGPRFAAQRPRGRLRECLHPQILPLGPAREPLMR